MDIDETKTQTTDDAAADPAPPTDGHCRGHYFGQSDTHDWVEQHQGDLLTLAPMVFAALDALTASDALDPPVPDSLRGLFVRHVNAGELLTGDEGCWRAGVAVGITNIVVDHLSGICATPRWSVS